ncbi:DUF3899 domain-containing protein [Terrilactibacillus sp. BCM23-1]|uniref:DUF3899 domain-containing protein n=1 Tax=Terrilactibacillus tamarindi TaxID=2599694 RepID=A0A6N8CN94_9BACI|nr:DUF3899 domain-containing protein [Terrilactibacillus tamarindi]MTT30563.1 DUF3899 domain-containing protein [Terrilactibacillus tamarindi]
MANYKRTFILFSIIFLIESIACLVGLAYVYHHYTFLYLLNALSMTGLTFLALGLIIFIVQSGFFDATIYSFHRFFKSNRKKQLIDDEDEIDDNFAPQLNKKASRGFAVPLISVSLIFFIMSLILSIIFY